MLLTMPKLSALSLLDALRESPVKTSKSIESSPLPSVLQREGIYFLNESEAEQVLERRLDLSTC